jgi:putative membrane protein
MCGWWDYGVSPPWYGMILGPVTMIVFVAMTVLVVAWVLRAFGLGWQSGGNERTPLDVLRSRFARGEIDKAEYEERRRFLSDPLPNDRFG